VDVDVDVDTYLTKPVDRETFVGTCVDVVERSGTPDTST